MLHKESASPERREGFPYLLPVGDGCCQCCGSGHCHCWPGHAAVMSSLQWSNQSVTGQQGDTPKGRKENNPPHPPDSQTQGVTTLLLAELSAVPLMVPSHGDSHRPHMQG